LLFLYFYAPIATQGSSVCMLLPVLATTPGRLLGSKMGMALIACLFLKKQNRPLWSACFYPTNQFKKLWFAGKKSTLSEPFNFCTYVRKKVMSVFPAATRYHESEVEARFCNLSVTILSPLPTGLIYTAAFNKLLKNYCMTIK